MRSIRNIGQLPAASALLADDLVEFHAGRLLLLHRYSGISSRIDGLTKLAKLDFFARYPVFFAHACRVRQAPDPPISNGLESPMVRHHYGPWDTRYYHVLAFLEGGQLLDVTKLDRFYRFQLTEAGIARAEALAASVSFGPIVAQMRHIKKVFGSQSGDWLKRFIYGVFDRDVRSRLMGETIR